MKKKINKSAYGMIIGFWLIVIVMFLFLPTMVRDLRSKKTLNIFLWPLILDAEYFKDFEKETGITLNISYYESSEELLSKLEATGGKGYDLVVPSDHTIGILREKGLLKKLDKNRLKFLNKLNPVLLGHYFDSENEYSLPYFWGVYGLGIDKNYFNGLPKASWSTIFESQEKQFSVCMTDNPREVFGLAALYLYGRLDSLKSEQRQQKILDMLTKQKKWVIAYTDARSEDFMISGSCPVVVAMSPDVWKVQQEVDHIEFVVPEEGSFLVIDNWSIPVATNKDDLVYEFLNYVYQSHVVLHHMQEYGMCPPIIDERLNIPDSLCPDEEQFKKLRFFKSILPEKELNELWISLMAE